MAGADESNPRAISQKDLNGDITNQKRRMKMRFKTVILALAVFLLGAAGLVFSSDSKVRVTASKANIRLKTDTQSAVVMSVPLGAVLDVIRKEGDWYYVKLPPDEKRIVVTGYLHQSTVEVIEETNPPMEPEKKAEIPHFSPKPVETSQEISTDAAYLKWKKDYSSAEMSFHKWKKYTTIGMFSVIGGCVAAISMPLVFRSGEGALVPLIAAGGVAVGGGILWLFAQGKRGSAKERMDLLMNEGRIKKYFAVYINPRTNSYAVTLTVAF